MSDVMMVRDIMKRRGRRRFGHSIKLYYGMCLLTVRRTTKNCVILQINCVVHQINCVVLQINCFVLQINCVILQN